MVLVIEDDKHYSLARIAGNSIINASDAESVEQILNIKECCSLSASVFIFDPNLWFHHRL